MNRVESGTVLGRSIKMRGELSGTEDLLLEGEFEGLVRLTGAKITVGAEARVRATLAAQDVIVFGRVEGEIRATGSVDLRDGSVVRGDILAARISIEEGAVLRGHVDPTRAGEPFPVTYAPAVALPPAERPAIQELKLTAPPEVKAAPSTTNPALNLFGKDAAPKIAEAPAAMAKMPAGLAAAARHFDAASALGASDETSATGPSSGDSPELAETKA